MVLGTQCSNLEDGQEASSRSVKTRAYELTLMDAQAHDPRSLVRGNKSPVPILKQVARKSSSSEEVATAADDLVGFETYLGGEGSSKSTSLTKRKC